MAGHCALYLRSSKDRKDVSPDAQRRALQDLAASRGEAIAEEFVDAVESGKDTERPGFQRMLKAVRNPNRGWSTLLMYDTARLSRRRVISLMFEELDCKSNDVTVVYKTMPDVDPLTEIVLKSVLTAWDEYHSLSSKQKGLAGMGENVRAGFRAGGRAPRGYQLRKIATGAVREGAAVTKSVLEPDPETADAMAVYLSARAAGTPRARAQREARLDDVPATSLIGAEWNALTYAGHTVWNVHAERLGGAYVGGSKRRPRSEWLMQRDTHPALITEEEAEQILAPLEARERTGKAARAGQRDRESGAMLGGLLFGPGGAKWWAEADRYRWPGAGARSIARDAIEGPVADQVLEDLRSTEFARRLHAATVAALAGDVDQGEIRQLRRDLERLATQISKTLDLVTQIADPAPVLRKVEELELERARTNARLATLETDARNAAAVGQLTVADVEAALKALLEDANDNGRSELRPLIVSVVERVELDPVTLDARVYYRVAAPDSGVRVASPRGFEPRCPP